MSFDQASYENEEQTIRDAFKEKDTRIANLEHENADLRAAHELAAKAHENRIENDRKIIAELRAEIERMRPVVEAVPDVIHTSSMLSRKKLVAAYREYEATK